MTTGTDHPTNLTAPNDGELAATSAVDIARELIWNCWSRSEHLTSSTNASRALSIATGMKQGWQMSHHARAREEKLG